MRPLLVLRPEPGATATAEAAAARGLAAIKAPLFAIRPIAWEWSGLAPPDALLLTSANAARAPALPRGRENPLRALPVYAVGEATAAAARAAGFAVAATGTDDAAAIVARAAADGVRRLLHLAGREHRAFAHPGVTIERLVVYASEAIGDLPAAARGAIGAGAVVLLHSPRAAAAFVGLVAAAGLKRGRVRIAALSPDVAAAAGAGWAAVAVAARPTDAALLAAAARLCEEGQDG